MKRIKDMSMEELGAFVCSTLEKEGIDTLFSQKQIKIEGWSF